MAPSPAAAQILPDRPITFLGGRVVVGGSASVAAASGEDPTDFNSGSYNEDTMGLVQVAAASSILLHPRAVVEADVRVGGEPDGSSWYFRPRSLVLRVQPFGSRSFSVAAGILQTAFGTAGARSYGRENLLIGRSLVYQYPTVLRGDALPRHVPDVLANRGHGAEAVYYVGRSYGFDDYDAYRTYDQYSGLPLVDPTGWNAGVQVAAGGESLAVTATLTDGSLSNPRSRGASGGWQASGRVEARYVTGLVVGASAAHGRYLDRDLSPVFSTALANRDPRETVLGVDVEYSRDYWLLRAETIHSRRSVPVLAEPRLPGALGATGVDVEGRYRLAPGLYAAARLGSLVFGRVAEEAGSLSWDANVVRFETGVGWSITRGLLVKAAYQYNRRDVPGPMRSAHRAGVEAMAWF